MKYVFFVLFGLIMMISTNACSQEPQEPVKHAAIKTDYMVDSDQLDQYSTEQDYSDNDLERKAQQVINTVGKVVGYVDLVDKKIDQVIRYDVFKGGRGGLFIYKWSPTNESEVKRYLTAKQKEMVVFD